MLKFIKRGALDRALHNKNVLDRRMVEVRFGENNDKKMQMMQNIKMYKLETSMKKSQSVSTLKGALKSASLCSLSLIEGEVEKRRDAVLAQSFKLDVPTTQVS